ncbi:MAG TPA: hypothetical protein VJ111_18440 [Chitinophagaceae bacterium]|nr:hypothetical protein [Chitinophagaceae bacterium]
MKKYIIGSVIGAILIFVWQALSWTVLGVHDDGMKYNPAQKEIMDVISANTTEDGFYMLPSAPTQKEQETMMKEMEGKPWASVIYHKSYNGNMAGRMIRAFLIDFILVILLIHILTRGGTPIPQRVFSGSVAIGLAFFLWGPYMGHTWFDLPWHMIKGDLIDALVAWSLCGAWLAWWLNRGKTTPQQIQ